MNDVDDPLTWKGMYIIHSTYTGIVRADHLQLEHENDIIPVTVT